MGALEDLEAYINQAERLGAMCSPQVLRLFILAIREELRDEHSIIPKKKAAVA